jgi:hypothetical protein
MKRKYSFLFRNGLSLVFLLLFLLSLCGQIYTGWKEHNEFLTDHDRPEQPVTEYLSSGHFIQATFENWESEFFQMALFVILTIFLRQEGSSESKACDDPLYDPGELKPKKDSPRSVKKGGIILSFYKHSLSIALFSLFVISFLLHWYGSWMDFNEKQLFENQGTLSFTGYFFHQKLWFESFQNWQSEFLSIFSIIFLSIYLREYGSSQSKPVNAAHSETGEE